MNSQIMPYTPEQSIEMVQGLMAIVQKMRAEMFKADVDFGVIPGTSKPTLLLPGMEKLMRALRLRAEYVSTEKVIDFENGIFFYEYECRLYEVDSGLCVGTAIGSANSRETKWRWREAKRACPKCGSTSINRSKYPPKHNPSAEPGWYCYTKMGGCGAEFDAASPLILEQQIGRMENPDIADQANTICKIAQKRSLASAIKCVANVSEFFTVDLEDMAQYSVSSFTPANGDSVVDSNFEVVTQLATPKQQSKPNNPPPAQSGTSALDAGFSVETARNFLGWAKRNYGASEESVREILDGYAGYELTAMPQFPGTILDAITGVMLVDAQDKNQTIQNAILEIKTGTNKVLAPTGKPFTVAELDMIEAKANELTKP